MKLFRSKILVLSVLGVAATLVRGPEAHAATATDNLVVTADVIATCTILAAPVNFGTYDVGSAVDHDATGTVTINCSNGSAVYVMLGEGLQPNAGSLPAAPMREMSAGGTDVLTYGLFMDAGHTANWGNTQVSGMARTGTGAADAITVYGRIPAGQGVLSGTYTDTVIATVEY
jgi:spore coat protein U-like protein